MKGLALFTLLFLVSCANYVSNIHRQIDREEKVARGDTSEEMQRNYAPYKNRFNRDGDKRPIKKKSVWSLRQN